MMGLSNLKVEQREKLYYSKYSYRAVCRVTGAYYTNNVKTLEEFKDRLESFEAQMKRYPIYVPKELSDDEYDTLEKLIDYIVQFEDGDKGTIRREGNTVTFFSNDLALLQKAPSNSSPLKLYEAELLPDGVKYFKRDVPASYRVHFKETKVATSIKQDILSFIQKNDGVEGSSALMRWLRNPGRWDQSWCSRSYYINYDDSRQLTMMHLLFPEVIGKNNKLEKK